MTARKFSLWAASCIILVLAACESKPSVEFIIHNIGEESIDSVRIYTSKNPADTRIYSIEPGMVKKGYFHVADGDTTTGNYVVKISTRVKGEAYMFEGNVGRYEKGVPTENKMEIWFSPDSIRYHPTPR